MKGVFLREFYSSTSSPKVREMLPSQWPIPTLCLGTNGSDVVFNYLSLLTMVFSLIFGFNELGNLGHCVLVDTLILSSAKYVIR